MMSVLEYAIDVNKKCEEILNLCKKLEISVKKADDMLSDDDIILLDNELANMEEDSVEEIEDMEMYNNTFSRRKDVR